MKKKICDVYSHQVSCGVSACWFLWHVYEEDETMIGLIVSSVAAILMIALLWLSE